MRILVSWIGHTDLRAMAAEQPQAVRDKVKAVTRTVEPPEGALGPVKSIIKAESFDRIFLFSNYPQHVTDLYTAWLKHGADVRLVPLEDPTDYGEIYAAVDAEMDAIFKALGGKGHQLSILLSPGTPAMAAIMVLLGKTKYPAAFHQAYAGRVWTTEIPFDLTLDFIPELLHGPDSSIQRLAAESPREIQGFERVSGESKAIRLAVGRARKAARRDVPVLLAGESGTGKEIFARAIHDASHRRSGPFHALNCAAIPGPLMESELFGHEKGAFTGADNRRDGAFQGADGGTLFLDEIGECAPDIQAKLLRVLQPPLGEPPCTREFQPVGSMTAVRSDVRVVAATNRDLLAMVREGVFREDLLYRLAVITVKLPPLRARRSDIAKVARDLLAGINTDFGRQEPGYRPKALSRRAQSFMTRRDWPGNVRELYNALLQAAVMSDTEEIGAADIRSALLEMPGSAAAGDDPLDRPLGDGFSLDEHLDGIQRHYLKRAMEEAGGVKARAAALLGLKSYQTLDARIKRLGVDVRQTHSSRTSS